MITKISFNKIAVQNIVLLIMLTCVFSGCESDYDTDDTNYITEYYNYNKYFNTSGSLIFKDSSYELRFGNIQLISSNVNYAIYDLSLFNLNIEEENITEVEEVTSDKAIVSLALKLYTPSNWDAIEGKYMIDTLKTGNIFTVSESGFIINTKDKDQINKVEIFSINEGNLTIESNIDYPYSGFESTIMRISFNFKLEDSEEINGEYIGRILINNNY